MKILIEVTLKRTDGAVVNSETVFNELEEFLVGESLEPQDPESDSPSTYEITRVTKRGVNHDELR